MRFRILILALATILLNSCSSQLSLYNKARTENSVEAYEQFLQKYPNSDFSAEAKKNLIVLEFQNAERLNSIEAYERFLEKYPTSEYNQGINDQIVFLKAKADNTTVAFKSFLNAYPQSKYSKEISDYLTTEETNTLEAFENFSKAYPNSIFQTQIKEKLTDLYFEKAKEENTIVGYQKFLEQNKHPKYEPMVQEAIQNLEYQNVTSISDAESFMKKYPNSPYFENALLKLVELKYQLDYYAFDRFAKKYENTKYKKLVNDKFLELEYNKALKSKSTWEISRFVKAHPDSKYSEAMKDTLIEIGYRTAKKDNSTRGMKNFLDEYPDSKYSNEIKNLLFDQLYKEIKSDKTYTGYMDFLNRFPNSKYESDLRSELYSLHLAHVKKENDVKAYNEFLQQYPNSKDYEEIESLLAVKNDVIDGYQAFLKKYPDSKFSDMIDYHIILKSPEVDKLESFKKKYPKSEYCKLAQQKIDNILFSQNFPEVLDLMKAGNFSNEVLLQKIDKLCLTPPTSISYNEFNRFQQALSSIKNLVDKKENPENQSIARFLYSFVELSYNISNAVGRSSLNIMIESATRSGMVKIDIFKVCEAAQTFLDFQLVMMLIDQDNTSRYRALEGLDRITKNNSLALSKRWTAGEKIVGFEVIAGGIPIRLDTIESTLDKMSKTETDMNNRDLIKKIQTRLNSI